MYPSLDKLALNRNRISVIEVGAFEGLDNITELRLDDNRLSELTQDMFQGIQRLQTLQLSRNLISTIRPRVYFHPPSDNTEPWW